MSLVLLAPVPLAMRAEEEPDPESLAPGLRLTFETRAGKKSAEAVPIRDTRRARLFALTVPEGTPPTPFLPPGPFRAVWDGFVEVEFFDDFTFSVEGRGTVRLDVAGKTLLEGTGDDLSQIAPETIEMEQGKQRVTLHYENPPSGDARLCLLWASLDFAAEPIGPELLFHAPDDAALVAGRRLRTGRELLATRLCLKCHEASIPDEELKRGMPELAADAPSFEAIGSRLDPVWMAHWIANPQRFRPTARMPRSFASAPGAAGAAGASDILDPRVQDVAAFLASLTDAKTAAAARGNASALGNTAAKEGEALVDTLGCIGCHLLPGDPVEPDDTSDRTPLDHVRSKWRPEALIAFLEQPERHFAWVRMPDFSLKSEEATALAAFLLTRDRATLAPDALTEASVTRGRELLETTGCLNCHALEVENRFRAAPYEQIAKSTGRTGCLASDAASRKEAPEFAVTPADREAIAAFLHAGSTPLRRISPPEFAERQITSLRCTSCHARDGKIDLWTRLAGNISGDTMEDVEAARQATSNGAGEAGGEEGATSIDQSRPPLTWFGEKLRSEWLAALLAGENASSVRPWLRARMPSLSAASRTFAFGLAMQQGAVPVSPPTETRDAEQAKLGRQLAARNKFSCNACHDVGETAAFGVFDAKGPDFTTMRERLRKKYFRRWMRNPLRITMDTKMPQFADDEGKSPFTDILDGEGPRQFEAIWHYLLGGPAMRPPD